MVRTAFFCNLNNPFCLYRFYPFIFTAYRTDTGCGFQALCIGTKGAGIYSGFRDVFAFKQKQLRPQGQAILYIGIIIKKNTDCPICLYICVTHLTQVFDGFQSQFSKEFILCQVFPFKTGYGELAIFNQAFHPAFNEILKFFGFFGCDIKV